MLGCLDTWTDVMFYLPDPSNQSFLVFQSSYLSTSTGLPLQKNAGNIIIDVGWIA
jgi:hypothetical protein